jgi:hypothetical protein
VVALPTSTAQEGDEAVYPADKTNGVYWQLLYDGEGEFPWKKIGGPPLGARSDAARQLTNQTTYANLPTDPLAITAPLKGDYDIRIEAVVGLALVAATGLISYAIGGTAASDNWSAGVSQQTAAGIASEVSTSTRQVSVTAGASVAEKGRTEGNYLVTYARRRLWIDPIRVG